ncbi:MAG: nucleotidyltransferase domain-containing protein [Candidatus Aenigmarchaeota archaeon]|nr:nucleotidyltransferase domain-containing protein [Candidatus Aenigmarchaeota archaeon]
MSEKIDIILSAFLGNYGAKLHVRQIARMVDMNRQTVSETLKKMEDSRVVDSETEGRNKLYFINSKSSKAKILLQNAENRKKLDICEKSPVLSRLVHYADSSSVILLFGSYAKGSERKDSDIDIIVINGRKNDFDAFEKETGKAVQAFEMSEKKFLERFLKKDHLVVEAAKNHVCLKNAERFVDIMWRANYG